MPDTPTFGRYAEILYDQMTPEQPKVARATSRSRSPLVTLKEWLLPKPIWSSHSYRRALRSRLNQ